MPDSEEKLFSDKHSDPGFTEFDEEMVSWISTHYKHLKDMLLDRQDRSLARSAQ